MHICIGGSKTKSIVPFNRSLLLLLHPSLPENKDPKGGQDWFINSIFVCDYICCISIYFYLFPSCISINFQVVFPSICKLYFHLSPSCISPISVSLSLPWLTFQSRQWTGVPGVALPPPARPTFPSKNSQTSLNSFALLGKFPTSNILAKLQQSFLLPPFLSIFNLKVKS